MSCLFCKIVNNEIPCYKIYEDNVLLAFLDINPDSNGHTLIIPKKHILDINDINNVTFVHVLDIVKKIKKQLEEKLSIDGLTLIQNNGDKQIVKHFHLHLKPYYKEKQEVKDVKEIYEILKNS